MRKKRTLPICVTVAVLALIASLAYNAAPREPSYDGRPLGFWVLSTVTVRYDPDQNDKATNAIDHIGVAALPFLVKSIQYERPRWRSAIGNLLYRTRFVRAYELADRIKQPRDYRLAVATYYAFGILGKRAMPVFDHLCRLMNDTNKPETAARVALALGCLGTNALPPLLAVAADANHPARRAAIDSIGMMSHPGDTAQFAVTIFANCLNPTNPPAIQMTATIALGNLKASPEISVPALISTLKSTNADLRAFSAAALSHFGRQASSAVPALTNALTDSDPGARKWAAYALHQIDPAAFP